MANIVERTLEALAFALILAAAVAFWYVTPANATDYGTYGMPDGTTYNANTGETYGADRDSENYSNDYRTHYNDQGYAHDYRR